MKRKFINKKSIAVLGVILLTITIFLYYYNESISYFGFVEIRELKNIDDEFTVTVEGNFGVRTTSFSDDNYFTIIENEEPREGNITEIWNHLSEGKTFHVLLKSYSNRNQFELEKIYID